MQCRFIRDKSGLFQTFHFEIELENEQKTVCIIFFCQIKLILLYRFVY